MIASEQWNAARYDQHLASIAKHRSDAKDARLMAYEIPSHWDVKEVEAQIRMKLLARLPPKTVGSTRAFALFNDDDLDNITRDEFKRIIRQKVGSNLSGDMLDQVFDRYDTDGSGELSSKEIVEALFGGDHRTQSQSLLHQRLERNQQQFDDAMRAKLEHRKYYNSGDGEDGEAAEHPERLSVLAPDHWTIDEVEQLVRQKVLARLPTKGGRRMYETMTLFTDKGSTRTITKAQFKRTIREKCGLQLRDGLVERLFDKIDADGSGSVDARELCQILFPPGIVTAEHARKMAEQQARRSRRKGSSRKGSSSGTRAGAGARDARDVQSGMQHGVNKIQQILEQNRVDFYQQQADRLNIDAEAYHAGIDVGFDDDDDDNMNENGTGSGSGSGGDAGGAGSSGGGGGGSSSGRRRRVGSTAEWTMDALLGEIQAKMQQRCRKPDSLYQEAFKLFSHSQRTGSSRSSHGSSQGRSRGQSRSRVPEVSIDTFRAIVRYQLQIPVTTAQCQEVFRLIDANDDGRIQVSEMVRFLAGGSGSSSGSSSSTNASSGGGAHAHTEPARHLHRRPSVQRRHPHLLAKTHAQKYAESQAQQAAFEAELRRQRRQQRPRTAGAAGGGGASVRGAGVTGLKHCRPPPAASGSSGTYLQGGGRSGGDRGDDGGGEPPRRFQYRSRAQYPAVRTGPHPGSERHYGRARAEARARQRRHPGVTGRRRHDDTPIVFGSRLTRGGREAW